MATYPSEGTSNDGKIVTAWVGSTKSGTVMEVARYTLSGSLDTTFGGTGEVTPFKGYARGVVVQPDGKVLVAGWTPHGSFAVFRCSTDGSLDTSFGSKGEAVINFGGGSYAYNVSLQADGKIVLAGEAYSGNWEVGLARLNSNGALDNSFGSGGEVVTALPNPLFAPDYRYNVTNLAIDPTSAKLVVGVRWQASGEVVLRYNTDGSLDTTFGNGAGYVTVSGSRVSVVVQPDERIVVADNNGGTTSGIFLARLNVDGTFDSSFGNGGTVITPPPTNDGTFVDSVALQSNGQILVGGTFYSSTDGLMVARWNSDGSLDTTFGANGFAFASGTGQGTALALEPDGRIVVAGNNIYSGGIELARFLAAGPQIGSFSVSANPVTSAGSDTLTVSTITDANSGATITQVAFYVEVNGTNTLLGYGTQSNGSWTLTFTVKLQPGTYTLFTQAEDSYGVFGDPLALSLTVQ